MKFVDPVSLSVISCFAITVLLDGVTGNPAEDYRNRRDQRCERVSELAGR